MTGLGFDGIGLMVMLFFLGSLIFSCIWILRIIFTVDQQDQQDQSDYVIPQQSAALELIIQQHAQGTPLRKKI